VVLVALASSAVLGAATAADLYTAALTHERDLRAPTHEPASLEQWREAIAAYQEIVRQYPRSGYSDNALWQAAGLASQAFDRYRQPLDRDAGIRALLLLEREYPSSSLVPQIAHRLEQLRRLDEPVMIRDIRRDTVDDLVRVTVELDDEVRYQTERLDGPSRVFFDFSGTYAAPPLLNATLAFDDSDIVREIRLGRHPEHVTRVVLDIEDVESYSVYTLYNPYRLVVDAVSTASMQARRATPDLAPPLTSAQDLLPMPEGWQAHRLEPLPPARVPDAAELRHTRQVDHTGPEDHVGPPGPDLHDLLYPNLGSPPSPAITTTASPPEESGDLNEPADEPFSVAALELPNAAEPHGLVFPVSMVDTLSPIRFVPPVVRETSPLADGPFANSTGDFSLGRQLGLGVSRIVIDPGHGGYDPGAQTGELTESALVLDVARRLETRLTQETDIEVILTRRSDAYVPLRARTELANRVGADLFLSIHANAAKDRSARGVETYYLDLATEPTGRAVAARENAGAREGMHQLPQLVQSITMHSKMDESRDLAALVQRNLLLGVRELHPGAQDLGVKQAPFVVLIGANMPSVLAEIAFLTNDEDAAFLATAPYRDRIADSLLQSILEYQQTLKPSTGLVADNAEN
jgi:N-acetylmuramoyl-L-alanine amidase